MKSRDNLLVSALGFLLLATLLPGRASAGDGEFNAIVPRLSDQYQKRPMRFMGLIDFIANRATPRGVSHLKMAIFDDLDSSRHPADSEFESFMQQVAGAEFHPFVHVRSNRDGEHTFIYARDVGKSVEMLIVTMEQTEAVVLKMRLKPEAMESGWMSP